MVNDFQAQSRYDEMECNAYNAAFHELGFRWYWDFGTYNQLVRSGLNSEEQIWHYLETQQPHLLKAYDAAFLVAAIQQKKAHHKKHVPTSSAMVSGHFDWAQTLGGELGA